MTNDELIAYVNKKISNLQRDLANEINNEDPIDNKYDEVAHASEIASIQSMIDAYKDILGKLVA